jgi:hypothetical protein
MKRLIFLLLIGLYLFSNLNAQTVKLKKVADNLTSPVTIVDPKDGSNRLFVVDQVGLIWIIDSTGQMMSTPFLDLRNKIPKLNPAYDERGLLGLAFHPNFKSNKKFYVHYTAPPADTAYNNNYVIAEFKYFILGYVEQMSILDNSFLGI